MKAKPINTSILIKQQVDHRGYLLSFNYLNAKQVSGRSQGADVLVPLTVLNQSDSYGECWMDGTAIKTSSMALGYQIQSRQHLVLIFEVDETEVAPMVYKVYQSAYQISQQLGYTHLLRTWNYLADINALDGDIERYQAFCVARHESMQNNQQLSSPNPAATAIGSHNGQNCFVFLFGLQAGVVIENKRQVSAWEYPLQYAPKQPRFSRALVLDGVLMCSGTASVVGHETIHFNNLSKQFDECLLNIAELIKESGLDKEITAGIYRFYLRDSQYLPVLNDKISGFGIEHYVILLGDVCRENLLVECEVVFQ